MSAFTFYRGEFEYTLAKDGPNAFRVERYNRKTRTWLVHGITRDVFNMVCYAEGVHPGEFK